MVNLFPLVERSANCQNPFQEALTENAKLAYQAAIILTIIGGILTAPLLTSTNFGQEKKANQSSLVAYLFTPLAFIGSIALIGGIVSISILAMTILLDGAHMLLMGESALSYRYVFFPYKLSFPISHLFHLE